MRVNVFVFAAMTWLAAIGVAADEIAPPEAAETVAETAAEEPIVNGEPLLDGFVIIKGEYVPPPYVVGTRGDELFLNGQPINTERLRMRHWGRRFHWGWRGPGADRGEDAPPRRDREGQRSESAPPQRGENNPPTETEELQTPVPSRPYIDYSVYLERRLQEDGLLIVFNDGMATFPRNGFELPVLKALVSDEPSDAKVQALMRIHSEQINSARWRELVDTFRPTADLKKRVEELDKARVVAYPRPTQTRSLSNYVQYGITVTGIVLGVLAFGTLLMHRPNSRAAWREVDSAGDSIPMVVRNVVLVAILSFFDLTCTLLAQSSIGFAEINPLGSHLLDSPLLLAGFKVTSLLLGCGILLALRRYRGAQIASWWLCLVCTILTFRWATYGTLFIA